MDLFAAPTTPSFNTTQETVKEVRYALEGTTFKVEKVVSTFKVTRENNEYSHPVVSRKKINEVVDSTLFNLVPITLEELAFYRESGVPSLVLKKDGIFYHAEIPKRLNLVSSKLLGAHQCAVAGHECNRLSAADDAHGGCAKVRDKHPHIEKYPWIATGYETFNMKAGRDAFVVVKCEHYEKLPPRQKLKASEISEIKRSLAEFIYL